MLCLRESQLSLFDSVLPQEALDLPEDLKEIDAYLDDDRFFEPFLARGQQRRGRPTIPLERFLRLMFLKFRYDLSYDLLVERVGDSFKWRRFCRIPLFDKMPHPTTLSKLVNRFGEDSIQEINRLLVQKMSEDKLVNTHKMRTDTTVTEAHIEYPTDADLLEDGVRVVTRAVKNIGKLSENLVEGFRDRTRQMKSCLIGIGHWLKRRTDDCKDKVNELTAKAACATEKMLEDAEVVAKRTRGFIGGCADDLKGKARKTYEELTQWMARTRRALEQTRQRLNGVTSIPNRMVSLFDTEARAIRRGVPGKPNEFGYKVRVDELAGGIVSGYAVNTGNPSDTSQAIPAVELHTKTFGAPPSEVAADRGYHSSANEQALATMGVKRISIPVRGKKSKKRSDLEKEAWFRRLQRWRAPQEATISLLTRCFGMRRARVRGHGRVAGWVGFGVLANNLKRLPERLRHKRRRAEKRRASRQ